MKRKGFTLVEIMIVVAIIALLAAIAIPNLMSAKKTANSAAAKANIRTISTTAEVYATRMNGVYPTQAQLTTESTSVASLCAATLAAPVQGYAYDCSGAVATGYAVTATAASTTAGDKNYKVVTGGVITEADYPTAAP